MFFRRDNEVKSRESNKGSFVNIKDIDKLITDRTSTLKHNLSFLI